MLVRQKTLYMLFKNVIKERKELQVVFPLMCFIIHYNINNEINELTKKSVHSL